MKFVVFFFALFGMIALSYTDPIPSPQLQCRGGGGGYRGGYGGGYRGSYGGYGGYGGYYQQPQQQFVPLYIPNQFGNGTTLNPACLTYNPYIRCV